MNSAYIVAQHILKLARPSSVFIVGEKGLKEELELAGHRLASPEEAEFLIGPLHGLRL